MTLHKSSRRSGLVCRHLLELFVCFLATCAAPGCVVTPALWDWAKDDDIGDVRPLGVAFGSADGLHDRLLVSIGRIEGLKDGDYQIEIPAQMRDDGPLRGGITLNWELSTWMDGNKFHETESGLLRLDEPLDLVLVRCPNASEQLSDSPVMNGTYPPWHSFSCFERGLSGLSSQRSLKMAERGVYAFVDDEEREGAHVLEVYARHPGERTGAKWVQLGEVNIGAGRPAPAKRRVVAVCLTPVSLVLEPVYWWFVIMSSFAG